MAREGEREQIELALEVAELVKAAPAAVLHAALFTIDTASLVGMRDVLRRSPNVSDSPAWSEVGGERGRCV